MPEYHLKQSANCGELGFSFRQSSDPNILPMLQGENESTNH